MAVQIRMGAPRPAHPGETSTVVATLRNHGEVVEDYHLDVLGVPGRWAVIEPESLALMPGTEAQATITFSVPSAELVPSGVLPWALRVQVASDQSICAVEESELAVDGLSLLVCELRPETARGRRRSRHRVLIENRGNSPAHVSVAGGDKDEALNVQVENSRFILPPGSDREVGVKIRSRVRGRAHLPFTIEVHDANATPIVLQGALDQRPLPKAAWRVPILLAALVLVGLIVIPREDAKSIRLANDGNPSSSTPSTTSQPPARSLDPATGLPADGQPGSTETSSPLGPQATSGTAPGAGLSAPANAANPSPRGPPAASPTTVSARSSSASSGRFTFLQEDGGSYWGVDFAGATSEDRPLVVDTNGDRREELAVYNKGRFTIRRDDGSYWGHTFTGAGAGEKPLAADTNGDGREELGVYLNGRFTFLRDDGSYWGHTFAGAGAGEKPVAADTNLDGRDELGVYLNGRFTFLRLDGSYWGYTFAGAGAGEAPLAADTDGDGRDSLGVYLTGRFTFLRDDGSYWGYTFAGAGAADTPLAVDTNGNRKHELAVFRAI